MPEQQIEETKTIYYTNYKRKFILIAETCVFAKRGPIGQAEDTEIAKRCEVLIIKNAKKKIKSVGFYSKFANGSLIN
jgi:hypothetical protein